MNREKGAAGAVCSTCGASVGTVILADGSVAAQACGSCAGAKPVESVEPIQEEGAVAAEDAAGQEPVEKKGSRR